MAVIYPKKGTATTSSGTFSVTIPATHGICKLIFVKAATSTTTFDVKLTDVYSLDVVDDTDLTGLYNEERELPVYGNFTLTISNASQDEQFTYLIVTDES